MSSITFFPIAKVKRFCKAALANESDISELQDIARKLGIKNGQTTKTELCSVISDELFNISFGAANSAISECGNKVNSTKSLLDESLATLGRASSKKHTRSKLEQISNIKGDVSELIVISGDFEDFVEKQKQVLDKILSSDTNLDSAAKLLEFSAGISSGCGNLNNAFVKRFTALNKNIKKI